MVNVALPITPTLAPDATLLSVRESVERLELIAVWPMKLVPFTVKTSAVALPSTLRMLIVSTPVTEAAGRLTIASSVAVMLSVSVPEPPSRVSETFSVLVAAPS